MSDLTKYTELLKRQSSITRDAKPMDLGYKPRPSNQLGTVRFPGWYRDVDGGVCVIYKDYLISIRFDEDSTQYHVCADVLGSRGLWDECARWESTYDITEAKTYALQIIKELDSTGRLE